jgi:hypothetical protein
MNRQVKVKDPHNQHFTSNRAKLLLDPASSRQQLLQQIASPTPAAAVHHQSAPAFSAFTNSDLFFQAV